METGHFEDMPVKISARLNVKIHAERILLLSDPLQVSVSIFESLLVSILTSRSCSMCSSGLTLNESASSSVSTSESIVVMVAVGSSLLASKLIQNDEYKTNTYMTLLDSGDVEVLHK